MDTGNALAGAFGATAALALVIVGLVLLILWIMLPFAVFGIRKRLDSLLLEVQRLTYATKIAHGLLDAKDAKGNAILVRQA